MMNESFSSLLLKWYNEYGRDLPWRNTTDPYRIWVSEIILQQTRVNQGYDYFVRFIRRFPTVRDLAVASLDEVMKYWQGLGYYSRARNLHAAAKQIVEMGAFPRSYEEVRALKGVGDYTAAAIVSFAYNEPRAVVDGNVYRVLARYFNIDTPIDTAKGKKTFQLLAQELLPANDAALYNQAIMDLGAMRCTPMNPLCVDCPLQDGCAAFYEGRVLDVPVKQHATKVRNRYFAYIYVRCGDEILLRKRVGNDIWKGLYEIPLVESDEPIGLEQLERLPWIASPLKILRKNILHQLSHQLLYVDFYLAECARRPAIDGTWVKESARDEYAVSRLMANLFAICDDGVS